MGEVVVAFFGSQGVYAYDLDGKPLWTRDLGRLDVGAYDLPDYEWGTASSPILYRDLVIVQCDQAEGLVPHGPGPQDRENGLAERNGTNCRPGHADHLSRVDGRSRVDLVTNAANFIRGYDPLSGKELWRLGGKLQDYRAHSRLSGDLILVASGRRPEAPIFAIRAGATGDITLPGEQTQGKSVAWSKTQRGSYMPTPLIYRGTCTSSATRAFRRLRPEDRPRDLPAAPPAPGIRVQRLARGIGRKDLIYRGEDRRHFCGPRRRRFELFEDEFHERARHGKPPRFPVEC